MIRGTAAWALGKIGGDESKTALQTATQQEEDQEVLQEIQDALQRLAH